MQAGFRTRQVAALTFTATAVAIATTLINAVLLVRMQVFEVRDRAEVHARTLHHLMREGTADAALRTYAEGVVGYSPVALFVAIRDERGIAVFHSDPSREGQRLGSFETLADFSKRSALSQVWCVCTQNRVLVADLPISADGVHPSGSIVVAVSTLLVRSRLLGAVATYALVAGAVALLAFLASFLVANRLLAPLEKLRAELGRIDTGGQPRLDLRSEADVGRLIDFFARASERGAQVPVHAMLDGVADAVIVFDRDRRVLTGNDAACRLFGKGRDELESLPLDALVPGDHPLRSLVDEALSRDEAVHARTVQVSVKGRPVSYLLSAHVLRENKRTRGVMVTARNVERLSRLGSQLTYSQKLAALGRLTSNVAHEIRNPLNALVIQATVLKEKLGDAHADAKRHLEIIESAVNNLNRVVDGFLTFTRPEEIELESVQVESVAREALELVSARAEQRGIRVIASFPPELPAVQGSADLLRQALLNLFGNAIDAMPQGGELRVRAEPGAEASILLSIEDTGEGITPEDLPKIFNLFHTTKSKGSGIGLSLVYRIVQLHGGEIQVDSKRGAGTRISMTLPERAA